MHKMLIKSRFITGLLFGICIIVVVGCIPAENVPKTEPQNQHTQTDVTNQDPAEENLVLVERVIDGDTFEISGDERVRLIGVDTPETVKPGTFPEPYGQEASDFTKSKLEGQHVELVFDVQERDQYGRFLAYVYLDDGTFFNELLVREGYGMVYTVPPNVAHRDTFLEAQRYAMENGLGIWGISDVNDELDRLWQDENGKGLIKGNINSQGDRIYHMPGGQLYEQTIPEVWFKTEREALEAGFRKSKR